MWVVKGIRHRTSTEVDHGRLYRSKSVPMGFEKGIKAIPNLYNANGKTEPVTGHCGIGT